MYGTIGRVKLKPGAFDSVAELMQEWSRDFQPGVEGFVATYVYRLDRDQDEIALVAVFKDKKSYMKNANDPGQDKWFQRLREHMTADPEWSDGEII